MRFEEFLSVAANFFQATFSELWPCCFNYIAEDRFSWQNSSQYKRVWNLQGYPCRRYFFYYGKTSNCKNYQFSNLKFDMEIDLPFDIEIKLPFGLGWANKKWGPLIVAKSNSDLPDIHRREAFVQFCSLWNGHSEIWDVQKGQILNLEFTALICPINNNDLKRNFSNFHYRPVGALVSCLASHPGGQGSNPWGGNFFTIVYKESTI